MPPPKGMRSQHFTTKGGDAVHIYSDTERVIIQLRHHAPTETDLMSPSFKVAVELAEEDVLAITGELLTALSLAKKQRAKKEKENG